MQLHPTLEFELACRILAPEKYDPPSAFVGDLVDQRLQTGGDGTAWYYNLNRILGSHGGDCPENHRGYKKLDVSHCRLFTS